MEKKKKVVVVQVKDAVADPAVGVDRDAAEAVRAAVQVALRWYWSSW